MPARKKWNNKIIWITGASTGIGRSLALIFLNEGATVIGSSRDFDKLSNLSMLESYLPIVADVSNPQSLADVSQKIKEKFGRIDVLIANAGICEYINMPDFDTAIMEKVMNINYGGCVNTISVALPLLRKSNQPYLIAMASSNAYLGLPRSQAYGPSKAAIYNLMQSLKADLHNDMDVSVICPGFVDSPLTEKNDFPMPIRISSEAAAVHILKGMEKRQFDINFPKSFTLLMKLVASLPNFILFRLINKLSRKHP